MADSKIECHLISLVMADYDIANNITKDSNCQNDMISNIANHG